MCPDPNAPLRAIPFQVLAKTLGIDLARFKRDERNKEWVGPCPYHKPKINTGCFHYHDDGRFNCFVCLKGFSGRGAIDFVKLMQTVDFQEATEFLRRYANIVLRRPP
jgi:DNA primase